MIIEHKNFHIMYIRGMIKNNVDFCYKKLYSQHRLIQTIPFRFGNYLGSDNKIFCADFIYTVGARAVSFTMVTGTRRSPIICTPSIPLISL